MAILMCYGGLPTAVFIQKTRTLNNYSGIYGQLRLYLINNNIYVALF